MTFAQRKVGQFHSEKKTKRCGSPHNIRVMYEIKGNKEVCSFRNSETALCDSHTKSSGIVPLENLRICVAVHTRKKSVTFTQKKENVVQTACGICDSHK